MTAREDIGERLKKGLEVFDGCVRRNICDGYGSATELHAEAYGGGSASVTSGDTALHFLRFRVPSCFLVSVSLFYIFISTFPQFHAKFKFWAGPVPTLVGLINLPDLVGSSWA